MSLRSPRVAATAALAALSAASFAPARALGGQTPAEAPRHAAPAPTSPAPTSPAPTSLTPAAAHGPVPRELPPPSGPHGVGRHLFVWVDSSRRDPADTARARAVAAWVWYPAARPAGRTAAEVALPGPWGDLRAEANAAKIGPAAAEAMRVVRVHAATGAPWAPDVGRAPVLLFTPGNGWLPTDYSAVVEDLASHGYVVAGVAPAGLADVVRFPDGRTVPKTLGVGPAIARDQVHAHDDVLHLLGRLAALDRGGAGSAGAAGGRDEGAFLRGHLDLARVGAFGHSLGGTTALAVAARDPRVRAALNLDGDPMGVVVALRPRQPLLFVSSEVPAMAEAPPGRDSAWYALTAAGLARSERRRTAEWAGIASAAAGARRVRLVGARHPTSPTPPSPRRSSRAPSAGGRGGG
jgi:pimeloyl-ACP methyl ester carboxylesterase